jgi:hypothetical protein
MLYNYESDG